VKALRPVKDGYLLTLVEIADRTEAEKWNGRTLVVPVEELSEPEDGEVFAHELVGMQLVDVESDAPIGEVVEFYELPQGLLLEFRTARGIASLPFVDEFVDEVDREARIIRVRLPDGLLDG
jgi:16S rRNA processing protein RimM